MRQYHYLRYNHFGVLRPNLLFWAVALFLARHILILLIIGVSRGRGAAPSSPDVVAMADPMLAIADIPTLMVLIALGARLPSAGKAARFIWQNGRPLLGSSCLFFLVILVLRQGSEFANWPVASWITAGLTCLIAVVLVRSSYLEDLFSQFPKAPPVREEK